MLFNSWEFVIFVFLTFGLYYAPWSRGPSGKAWQVTVALIASTIFYGWQDPKLIGLLAISCVGNSIATGRIIQHKVAGDDIRVRNWTRRAVIMNLSLLAIFKYLAFVAGMLPFLPETWLVAAKSLPLPIGISFYTFHGISMIVDVSRGEVTREGNALVGKKSHFVRGVRDIGFYLMFFPQLVAGPIVKAKDFWPQIAAKRIENIPWKGVIRALIVGYFLKIFVADNLAEQTTSLTLGSATILHSGPLNLIPLLYAYSFQIFADFAGYSLIAIGLASMFGYRFPTNFNFPYISTSMTEFWRRWHMSLSGWLRDYLYIPLGGNRKGSTRTYINLFLVMFLGGLWHGAEWKFALWGILHGTFLALEKLTSGSKTSPNKSLANTTDNLSSSKVRNSKFKIVTSTAKGFIIFHIVTLLWLTFLMPDMASIAAFFKVITVWNPKFSGPPIFSLLFYGTPVILYHAWGWLGEHHTRFYHKLSRSSLEPILHGLMIFLILTNPGAPRGFIYFQF